MNIRPYSMALRREGFTKEWDSRAGGCRCVQFTRTTDDRKVEVQLWDDGRHRASHFLRGRMSTLPTDFANPEEMLGAITREMTRTDHPCTG